MQSKKLEVKHKEKENSNKKNKGSKTQKIHRYQIVQGKCCQGKMKILVKKRVVKIMDRTPKLPVRNEKLN